MIVVACVGILLMADADSGRIRCDDGRTVAFRLHGWDGPEASGLRARCRAEQARGRAAAAEAKAAFDGARVQLDAAAYRDPFGRLVGLPVLETGPLAELLAARGLVIRWDFDGGAPKPRWCP